MSSRIAGYKQTLMATRSSKGIVEGVAGIVIFISVFVLLVMFGINVYATITAHQKLSVVATECARVVDAKKFWLGMRRPNLNEAEAQSKARLLGQELCKRLGLPQPKVEFKEEILDNGDIIVTSCTITCKGMSLPFSKIGVFPAALDVSETGVSGTMAVEPYAAAFLEVGFGPNLSGANRAERVGVVLPIYGTTVAEYTHPSFRNPNSGGILLGPMKGPFETINIQIGPKAISGSFIWPVVGSWLPGYNNPGPNRAMGSQ